MQTYQDNIDGSFIEQRVSCLLWNFKKAEEEHGIMFLKEMHTQLEKVIDDKTEIICGNGYLEVKPKGIKKEKLISLLLRQVAVQNPIDFLLFLGSDSSDESVHDMLKSDKVAPCLSKKNSMFLCTLEKKPSSADFFIEEIADVSVLLGKLSFEAKKKR